MSTRNLVLIAVVGLLLVLAYDLYTVDDVAEAPSPADVVEEGDMSGSEDAESEGSDSSGDTGDSDGGSAADSAESDDAPDLSGVEEAPVTYLPLAPPANARDLEYSGMSWFEDQLVLLPQYPDVDLEADEDEDEDEASEDSAEAVTGTLRSGRVYALDRSALLAAVAGDDESALAAEEIPFSYPAAVAEIEGFEGFESIAFEGERVYLTVEAQTEEATRGYLVAGTVTRSDDGRLASIALDASAPVEVALPANLDNMSLESILVDEGNITAFFEANGAAVNPAPKAFGFDASLAATTESAFPTIEYRVTDSTEPDENGSVWVINYHFPGEDELLQPQPDALLAESGEGPTHGLFDQVERIVELVADGSGFALAQPTGRVIQLRLVDAETSRNWEGIARLEDRGFLLVTDKYPETILGFVALPAGDSE